LGRLTIIILRLEEQALKKSSKIPLPSCEMHLIECVGKQMENGRTISELATISTSRGIGYHCGNKLEKKGYVTKSSCENDGRSCAYISPMKGKK
jgi:hypothetical protein